MPHPYFDLDDWRKRLLTNAKGKIDETDAQDLPGLFTDSPSALVGIEYYRHLAQAKGLDLGPSLPVDRCAFGKGEPPERHLTKVHGLPYRPRSLKWPTDEFGKPLIFLAQYSFIDSFDHMPPLPGDVLLIFIKDMDVHIGIDFEFEWHKLGIDDLVMSAPQPAMKFPTCYGVRHRSCDFFDEPIAANVFKTLVKRTSLMNERPWFERLVMMALSSYRGMKIGGIPFWERPGEISKDVYSAGRFICAFNGVSVLNNFDYPYVNVRNCLNLDESMNSENNLLFCDGLILNFYLDGDGLINWFGQLS